MIKVLFIALVIIFTRTAPFADKMTRIPGYPSTYNTSIYTGYLDTANPNRSLHYVFVESVKGANNNDPVTLWLNGGPGCSSLLGFIQEIGPYYLEDGIDYKPGDNLNENKYSWHKVSNLLFLQSPAGVGYSYNLDNTFQHDDASTAMDSRNAVIDFFKKYPEYRKNKFFIAGQSYAGKYIPDLAVLIDQYNLKGQETPINLKSIFIGNGVMTFATLQFSTYEFMIDRRFVDPEIVPIYRTSCQTNPRSESCRHFEIEYEKGTEQLNPYNVYGYCFYNDSFDLSLTQAKPRKKQYASQQSILEDLKKKYSQSYVIPPKLNGAPCAYFDGIFDYFNLNEKEYHAKFKGQLWNGPCAQNITYKIDPSGSLESYGYLIDLYATQRKIQIVLYNGNWDAVVPFVDTLKGIKLLNLVESYIKTPWFTDRQHSGFQQIFSNVIFVTVKGASHQVPQSKRAESFNLFDALVTEFDQREPIFKYGIFNKRAKTVQTE